GATTTNDFLGGIFQIVQVINNHCFAPGCKLVACGNVLFSVFNLTRLITALLPFWQILIDDSEISHDMIRLVFCQ
ncbi:hypothetical protein, partial [Microseira wollei]|uniref:hypothetical protein n=1 Tax=Microseira wollei TaxID=467598 RepID=UPI001CFD470C